MNKYTWQYNKGQYKIINKSGEVLGVVYFEADATLLVKALNNLYN